jgi:DNA repair protein RecO (recombination protein O)
LETTVHAIVLRRTNTGETDRRLTVLTLEHGKIDVVAKGARKAASRLAGSSDPLSVAIFSFAAGKKNRFVTQAQPLTSFRGLRTDYERLSLALALCELYAAVLPWEEPMPEAYELLADSLRHLESHPKPLVALAWSEIQLLMISGFMPQFDRCVVTDAAVSEVRPLLSPRAGGYVTDSAAGEYGDRFRTRVEVLYGLARLPEFSEPPSNLKFVEQALSDLLRFWQSIAETALPANQSAIAALSNAE